VKWNEYAEPTEMAGVAEAETEAAYAWALDYDDVDEFPTQRLTSRRITALSIAVSLVVIAVAGVVALVVVRDANQPVAQAPSPHVVETVGPPAPLSPTPIPPYPPNPAGEASFVSDVYANIPTADIPGGRPTDNRLVAYGYQACLVMDRYPNPRAAAEHFYAEVSRDAGNTRDPAKISKASVYNEGVFMEIAAQYLCHSASPPASVTVTGQAPASPVTPVESPPVQAGCTEGATRVLQGEGDISTCENGQWHEGPYGYRQKPAAQPHGGWCGGNGSVEAIAPNGRSMFCVTGSDGAGSWEYGP
jgi:hypothetical protein